MAFDQTTRNRLQRFVSDARSLLTEEFTRQLQNTYGLDPDSGAVTPLERVHLEDARRETARILRDTLAHYLATTPSTSKAEVLERIVREQAFTLLNRVCALRMAEARCILIESLAVGYNSKGFQLYARLAGTALGETGDAYRNYLFSIFDEFALDLKVLFDRFSPQGLLFPRESALLDLLALINDPEIESLWSEDETIGWIYQYFNSREERKEMRDASPAPRDSRELAVRNQFFTPRYVVEFLTDNTLGRIWYEMRRGDTKLKEQCRYLVRRQNEMFLKSGNSAQVQTKQDDLSQEELLKRPVPIAHRPLKDPRTILMLDPACGSMHFGLYAFDLFEVIYDEAWELEENLGADALSRLPGMKSFHDTYAIKEAFLKDVPCLVIEHNLHGIDIDPRCAQIAGLSLWLRAHKVWERLSLKPGERPAIKRSNIVCAEPMPGEKELLREFVDQQFPAAEHGVFLQLLETIFDQMQLAGEAGSLLKIEEEILSAITKAKELWRKGPQLEQSKLFAELEPAKQKELKVDLSGITDEQFWNSAEGRIYDALRKYAEQAEGGGGFQRRLFAEDAARGFAFIDVCRKRYDVALMNPPFGEPSEAVLEYMSGNYKSHNANLLCAFVARAFELGVSKVAVGAIYDRTAVVKSTYENFRRTHLLQGNRLFAYADLGWGVLDANVEATSSVFQLAPQGDQTCVFADVRSVEPGMKGIDLLDILGSTTSISKEPRTVLARGEVFLNYPNAVVGYDFPSFARRAFSIFPTLTAAGATLFEGHTIKSEVFFRYWWEVPMDDAFVPNASWQRLYNGGDYQRYVSPLCDAVLYGNDGNLLASHASTVLRNLPYQQHGKIGFGKRGEYIDAHVVPEGFVSTVEGKHVVIQEEVSPYAVLALLNSKLFQTIINLYCGQHKYPGYVGIFPCPDLRTNVHFQAASEACHKIFVERDRLQSTEESSPKFGGCGTACIWDSEFLSKTESSSKCVDELEEQLNESVFEAYGLDLKEREQVNERCKTEPSIGGWWDEATPEQVASSRFSFLLGTAFGRWDIRYAMGEKAVPEFPDPFAPLPVCSPVMLQNAHGLPVCQDEVPAAYPVRIPWEGILVDDPNDPLDIERRVREVAEIIWGARADGAGAEAIEHEACQILGVKSLREYFRKPVGFFTDHLKQYSKSRRQAPIYWPLSTSSGSLTLWIYYHRLNDETLYTCINDFVVPRLRDVTVALNQLRAKGETRTREDEREFERLQGLELEFQAFQDELLRLARLPWKPNLNDGVQITAAPLWRLFRLPKWQNTLKEAWQELENGEYDWAHLAYTLWPDRVKERCKTDRFLAIAHGLEELYEQAPTSSIKKTRTRRKAV